MSNLNRLKDIPKAATKWAKVPGRIELFVRISTKFSDDIETKITQNGREIDGGMQEFIYTFQRPYLKAINAKLPKAQRLKPTLKSLDEWDRWCDRQRRKSELAPV